MGRKAWTRFNSGWSTSKPERQTVLSSSWGHIWTLSRLKKLWSWQFFFPNFANCQYIFVLMKLAEIFCSNFPQDEFPPSFSEYLQQKIREKFINVTDPEKCGLPKVLDSIEVSCKSRQNMKLLANLLYDTAFGLKTPGKIYRFIIFTNLTFPYVTAHVVNFVLTLSYLLLSIGSMQGARPNFWSRKFRPHILLSKTWRVSWRQNCVFRVTIRCSITSNTSPPWTVSWCPNLDSDFATEPNSIKRLNSSTKTDSCSITKTPRSETFTFLILNGSVVIITKLCWN